jgi:hypothetical protein
MGGTSLGVAQALPAFPFVIASVIVSIDVLLTTLCGIEGFILQTDSTTALRPKTAGGGAARQTPVSSL